MGRRDFKWEAVVAREDITQQLGNKSLFPSKIYGGIVNEKNICI